MVYIMSPIKVFATWYEFAVEILRQAGLQTPIIPVTSDQYPQKAKRPAYSVLDHYNLRLIGMDDMRSWQEALSSYMIEKKVKIDNDLQGGKTWMSSYLYRRSR